MCEGVLVSINEKVGVGFLAAFAIACALCLFLVPDLGYGKPGHGLFRLLPGKSLFVVGIVFSVAMIVIVFVNKRRQKKGKPPI